MAPRADGSGGAPFAGVVAVAVLVGLPVLNAHVLQPWVENSGGDRATWWADQLVLLGAHVLAFAAVTLAVRRSTRIPTHSVLRSPTALQAWIGVGIIAGAVLILVARQIGLYEGGYSDAFTPTDGGERAMFLANGIMVGGVQEPLWRGYSYEWLRHWRCRVAVAVVITAVSFGYYHGGVDALGQVAFTGGAGLMLSWLYLRTGTIWWPILLHAGFNVVGAAGV